MHFSFLSRAYGEDANDKFGERLCSAARVQMMLMGRYFPKHPVFFFLKQSIMQHFKSDCTSQWPADNI